MKENLQQHNKDAGNKFLLQYTGLAAQFIAGICVAGYAGLKADEYLKTKIPVFVWILPVIVIIAMLVKIIKDTSKK
jgi:F0F1-type ATP synthase assembly protein I